MQIERFKEFDAPEEFDAKKMAESLESPDVLEVHVFKNTPKNMRWAELRKNYPNKNRKQLRKMLKEAEKK